MKNVAITLFPPLDYAAAEAINTLCTNLSFAGAAVKKIMITSCHASEGKSYLAMNIMRTMASLGKVVTLVDADLRRSQIGVEYGLQYSMPQPQGLTHYLAGMATLEDVVYATDIEGAYMVPVGREVSNSLSLLNTPRLPFLLDNLAKQMDFVIVDAPPVGVIIDAAEIAKSCDGTLFAVSYNEVARKELANAKRQIDQTGCRVLGAALNNIEMDSYTSRKYYNKSYYSHYNSEYLQPEKRRGRAKKQPNLQE